jgi:SAM-dependent methyltransferase
VSGLGGKLLRIPGAGVVARHAADWIDLQWSYLIAQLKAVAPRMHGRLLDVGCGDCPYEWIFRPYVEAYVGVEHEATFALTMAAAGRDTRRKGRPPDLSYDGETLPFDDGFFDCVLSVQVLEHTPHPDRLVAEMSRVLKRGGVLVVNAPFSFRLHAEPHDYFRYTPHGLAALCVRHGLRVAELMPQGHFFSVVGHKLNSYLAFHVANMGALMQDMGKLGHEGQVHRGPRTWTLPFVVPAMLGTAAAARVLDRVLPDRSESLSYLVVAEKT